MNSFCANRKERKGQFGLAEIFSWLMIFSIIVFTIIFYSFRTDEGIKISFIGESKINNQPVLNYFEKTLVYPSISNTLNYYDYIYRDICYGSSGEPVSCDILVSDRKLKASEYLSFISQKNLERISAGEEETRKKNTLNHVIRIRRYDFRSGDIVELGIENQGNTLRFAKDNGRINLQIGYDDKFIQVPDEGITFEIVTSFANAYFAKKIRSLPEKATEQRITHLLPSGVKYDIKLPEQE